MKPAKKNSPAAHAAEKPRKKGATISKPVRKRKTADAPEPPPEITEVEIATCAYFIYVSEGCPAGREMDHWLEAEARLKSR